ncbi:hypothetical protein EJB05_35971, partial [Eragrostis curvula]
MYRRTSASTSGRSSPRAAPRFPFLANLFSNPGAPAAESIELCHGMPGRIGHRLQLSDVREEQIISLCKELTPSSIKMDFTSVRRLPVLRSY